MFLTVGWRVSCLPRRNEARLLSKQTPLGIATQREVRLLRLRR